MYFRGERDPRINRLAAHICGMSLSAGRKLFKNQLQVLQQRNRAIDTPFLAASSGIQPGGESQMRRSKIEERDF